ncbi:PREDICTED: high mobility group protein B1-like [Acanthisitta chloris]|uniref:high mobility group protein B1-like n=1 Tax=Acanthisitta chloris TaxID=57068 RepID=UPI0004F0F9F6|nr:PREDICTED: high mobility group protein B1-like [Acanthisitta chloris]
MARPVHRHRRKVPSAPLRFRILVKLGNVKQLESRKMSPRKCLGKGKSVNSAQRHRKELQDANPHWTVAQTAKQMGRMWRNLPEEDKEKYREQAAQLREKQSAGESRVQGRQQKQPEMEFMVEKQQSKKNSKTTTVMVNFATKAGSLCEYLRSFLQ